jgi:hypothetical protein
MAQHVANKLVDDLTTVKHLFVGYGVRFQMLAKRLGGVFQVGGGLHFKPHRFLSFVLIFVCLQ